MRSFVFLALLFVFNGCSAIQDRYGQERITRPHRIHRDQAQLGVFDAEQLPVHDYVRRLKVAHDEVYPAELPPADFERKPADLEGLVNAGIALVDTWCLRWFQAVEIAQQRFDYDRRNYNVISSLGTAVLGIASASADAVSVYGAANTAINGLFDNVNETFLVKPTAKKVKERIFDHLTDRAGLLRERAKGDYTFEEAYADLERYGDLCTPAAAKVIVDESVGAVKSETDESGRVEIVKITGSFTPNADSETVLSRFRKGGTIDKAEHKRIEDWLRRNKLNISIGELLYLPDHAAARKRMTEELYN